MKLLLALWFFLVGVPTCMAAECSRDDAYVAETAIDHLTSWENVHLFYKQFAHCYDGAIAEGAQDRMQRLWVDRWGDLPKMIALMKKDAGFEEFVLRSLKTEAFPRDEFERVVRNAKTRCPAVAREFCRVVRIEAAKWGVSSNRSIDTDVLSAGFARLLSAGHLQR